MTFWTNGLLGAITLTIPASVIIAYNGTIASIPSGWYLCDGTNSTPNLTNKFIRCADDSTLNKGATGGSTTGQVTGSSSSEGGHGGIGGAAGTTLGGGGAVQYGTAGAHSHTLTGDMDWKPPSRELIYIKSYTNVTSNFSHLTLLWQRIFIGFLSVAILSTNKIKLNAQRMIVSSSFLPAIGYLVAQLLRRKDLLFLHKY